MADMPSCWRATAEGVILSVRATPKASKDAIGGVWLDSDGRAWLQVKVRAVPEDGGANSAIIALLARTLGVARSAITLESGGSARLKQFRLTGSASELGARLDLAAGGSR